MKPKRFLIISIVFLVTCLFEVWTGAALRQSKREYETEAFVASIDLVAIKTMDGTSIWVRAADRDNPAVIETIRWHGGMAK